MGRGGGKQPPSPSPIVIELTVLKVYLSVEIRWSDVRSVHFSKCKRRIKKKSERAQNIDFAVFKSSSKEIDY